MNVHYSLPSKAHLRWHHMAHGVLCIFLLRTSVEAISGQLGVLGVLRFGLVAFRADGTLGGRTAAIECLRCRKLECISQQECNLSASKGNSYMHTKCSDDPTPKPKSQPLDVKRLS